MRLLLLRDPNRSRHILHCNHHQWRACGDDRHPLVKHHEYIWKNAIACHACAHARAMLPQDIAALHNNGDQRMARNEAAREPLAPAHRARGYGSHRLPPPVLRSAHARVTSKRNTRRCVAAGEIERDPAQQNVLDRLAALEQRLTRASAGAQVVVARLAVRRARAQLGADQGPLPVRRGRPRQDHADGPVLRGVAGACASGARISTNSWPTCTNACAVSAHKLKIRRDRRRGSDPAHRRGDRRRNLAAVL